MSPPTRSALILGDRAVRLTIRHVHRGVFVVEGEGGEVLGASGNAEHTGRVVADALSVRPEEHGARSIAIEGHAVEGSMQRDEGVTGFRLRVSRSADTFTVGVGPLEATVASPRPGRARVVIAAALTTSGPPAPSPAAFSPR